MLTLPPNKMLFCAKNRYNDFGFVRKIKKNWTNGVTSGFPYIFISGAVIIA